MYSSSKYLFLVVLLLFLTWFGAADEGMWMPHRMKQLNLESQGLKMDPGNLYKEDGTGIMNAVVRIGGGASGAFVSSKGLILTNHHVAFGVIQRASDKEHDYITNGFLAHTTAGEIPARGSYANVLLGYRDVTPIVLKQLKPRMTPEQRYKALERIEKKLVAKAETPGKDRYCMFKPMYSGNKYYLFTFKRLWDVRIVYVPPLAIGNYGGEVDNWTWPRHTCDFTFLRAYVSGVNFEIAGSLFHDAYLFMKEHSIESGFGKAKMFRVDTEKGIVIGKCFEEGNIHFHTLLVIQPDTDMKKAISVLDKVIQSLKGEV
jgi:hypothetical protein